MLLACCHFLEKTQPVQNHKNTTRTSRLCFQLFRHWRLCLLGCTISHMTFFSLFINHHRSLGHLDSGCTVACDTGLVNSCIPHVLGTDLITFPPAELEIFTAWSSQRSLSLQSLQPGKTSLRFQLLLSLKICHFQLVILFPCGCFLQVHVSFAHLTKHLTVCRRFCDVIWHEPDFKWHHPMKQAEPEMERLQTD